MGLLSYIVYSAAIVSTLSIRVLPITTFTKLMESQLQVYADSESSTMKYILEACHSHYTNLIIIQKLFSFIHPRN